MIFKYCAFALLALCAMASKAQAQECVARSVVNMTVDVHHILSWAVIEDEICDVTQFLVYIHKPDQPIAYSFEVDEPWVDVSFLEVCHEWIFVVVPVSQHTKGHEHRLFSSLPLPADADLSIDYINVTRNGATDELHLSWDLVDKKYDTCSLRYRLTIEQDGEAEIHDLYLSERFINLHFLSPCTKYQFGVRAINIAHPTIEGPLRTEIDDIPPAVQIAPHLYDIELGFTGFIVRWELQSVEKNRCEVIELLIDGGDHFMRSIQINNERKRIKVEIDNLFFNTMYYFRAYVRNTAGWSAPTVVAIHTLGIEADKAAEKSVQ